MQSQELPVLGPLVDGLPGLHAHPDSDNFGSSILCDSSPPYNKACHKNRHRDSAVLVHTILQQRSATMLVYTIIQQSFVCYPTT